MSDRRIERLDTLFDSYQILSAIGTGTLGTVYRAKQIRLNRHVVVKFIDGVFAGAFKEDEFHEEVTGLAAIYHPNVATIIDAGTVRGQPFIVSEWVNGMNLIEFIDEGVPDVEEVVGIVTQLCSGLAFVHGNDVLHLDLTPRHVMLSDLGWVKLVDFRMSRPMAVDGQGNDHGLPFFSPELIFSAEVDTRADVYSVGKIIWFLLSGDLPPIQGDADLDPVDLPEPWRALVAKAIRIDPAERFESVGEISALALAAVAE